jgi:hypothetical protein
VTQFITAIYMFFVTSVAMHLPVRTATTFRQNRE